jgi:tryptophan 7-halogenase
MIDRVIVLGGGSAGFLAALALKSKHPDLQVTVIRSKDIGIIGVGEGSTAVLTRFLHDYIRVGTRKFFEVAQPTWKLGLRFLWGPRGSFNYTFNNTQLTGILKGMPRMKACYCWDEMENEDPLSALMSQNKGFERDFKGEPVFHPNIAYHVENEKFVRFLEEFAVSMKIPILEDKVTSVEQNDHGIVALQLESGRRETADLFVDASGFVSFLLSQKLHEPFISFQKSLFCDRAVVGGWDRKDMEDQTIRPYTTCEAMDSGWCWQIEHENRINRGYVYSSGFISDADAEKEFRTKNPKVGPTRIVPFISGRYRNLWVKNVVAVGNAGGFVEPLEATALGAISFQAATLADTLTDCGRDPTPSAQRQFNRAQAGSWDDIRDFLTVHYKFNTAHDTPFWRHCREATDVGGAADFIEVYQENGPCTWLEGTLSKNNQFGSAGFLALMLGQKVAHGRRHSPTGPELQAWSAEKQRMKSIALNGLSVRQTLAAIRSPSWKWRGEAGHAEAVQMNRL